MKPIEFVAQAREEFLLEVEYYNSERPGLGGRFAQDVEEALARAAAFPQTGSLATKNTRRVFLKNFPFALIYSALPDKVIVFAVAHHRRRPDYWRSRVQEKQVSWVAAE